MLQHLEELRRRLVISAVTVVIGFGAAFSFAPRLMEWLRRPLGREVYFFSPTEALWTTIKVALFAGLILALPVVLFQIWRFVSPGLFLRERRYGLLFIFGSLISFALGVVFCALVALPFALAFLLDFGISQGMRPLISVGQYISFSLKMYLAFGLIFEVPLVLTLLARAGIVTSAFLARNRRYAFLINAIAAAVLTPTTDLLNMMFMLVPLTLLYELGILGSWVFGRRAVRPAAVRPEEA